MKKDTDKKTSQTSPIKAKAVAGAIIAVVCLVVVALLLALLNKAINSPDIGPHYVLPPPPPTVKTEEARWVTHDWCESIERPLGWDTGWVREDREVAVDIRINGDDSRIVTILPASDPRFVAYNANNDHTPLQIRIHPGQAASASKVKIIRTKL